MTEHNIRRRAFLSQIEIFLLWFSLSSFYPNQSAFADIREKNEENREVIFIDWPKQKLDSPESWYKILLKCCRYLPKSELEQLSLQLAADPIPVPPRLGAIFVPNIIKRADVSPSKYTVLDNYKKPVAIERTGKKSFVFPGEYTVKIGAHSTDILPPYKVRVKKGKIAVILARWAALVVRVVDTHLIQFRGTYDLIYLKTRQSVGTGIGADDTLGEKVQPWLLPPGLYMIVRVGDSYLARTNFFTVRLSQGKVTYFRLVMDRATGDFLGGGELPQTQIAKKRGGWEWNVQLSGNFLWNQLENVSGSPSGHSFNLSAFAFARVSYNKKPNFFLTTLNIELGFTIPSLGEFRKSTDLLDLQSIYIYRIWRWFGPYVRAGVETVVFPDRFFFSQGDPRAKQPLSIYYCRSVTCQLQKTFAPGKFKDITLSGIFDPVSLKEGVGVDLQAIQTQWLDLRILFGFGFRQEIARQVYQFDPRSDIGKERCKDPKLRNPYNPLDISSCPEPSQRENHTSLRLFPKESSHREGLELAIVSTGRPFRFLSFTLELDILAQFIKFLDFDVDGRATVTFRLSHYASLNYRIRIRRDPALPEDPNNIFSKWSLDQSLVLSISILF